MDVRACGLTDTGVDALTALCTVLRLSLRLEANPGADPCRAAQALTRPDSRLECLCITAERTDAGTRLWHLTHHDGRLRVTLAPEEPHNKVAGPRLQ